MWSKNVSIVEGVFSDELHSVCRNNHLRALQTAMGQVRKDKYSGAQLADRRDTEQQFSGSNFTWGSFEISKGSGVAKRKTCIVCRNKSSSRENCRRAITTPSTAEITHRIVLSTVVLIVYCFRRCELSEINSSSVNCWTAVLPRLFYSSSPGRDTAAIAG